MKPAGGGRPSVSLITSGFPFLNSDAPAVDGHRDGYGDALSVCYCFRLMSYEGLVPPSLPSEASLTVTVPPFNERWGQRHARAL